MPSDDSLRSRRASLPPIPPLPAPRARDYHEGPAGTAFRPGFAVRPDYFAASDARNAAQAELRADFAYKHRHVEVLDYAEMTITRGRALAMVRDGWGKGISATDLSQAIGDTRDHEVTEDPLQSESWAPRGLVVPDEKPRGEKAVRPRAVALDVVQHNAQVAARAAEPSIEYAGGDGIVRARVRDPHTSRLVWADVAVDAEELAAALMPPPGAVSSFDEPEIVSEHRDLTWEPTTRPDEAIHAARRIAALERETAARLAYERASVAERYRDHAWFRWATWLYRAAQARARGHVYHRDGSLRPADASTPHAVRQPVNPIVQALVAHYNPKHGAAKSVVRP